MMDESPKSATDAVGEQEAQAASDLGETDNDAGTNELSQDSDASPAESVETEQAGEQQAGEQQGESEPPEDLHASLEAARKETEQLRDAALRAQAETENVRRRATRDVENAHRFALEKFTSDLLSVVDSLEKAVESAATATDAAAVGEGVQLSLKLFLDTLQKHGIDQVDPHGEPFDPAQQEALAVVANPDAEPNSVMEVVRKGYLLNGRVVRAAQVIVSKTPEEEPK